MKKLKHSESKIVNTFKTNISKYPKICATTGKFKNIRKGLVVKSTILFSEYIDRSFWSYSTIFS